jgi:hypothetical protein
VAAVGGCARVKVRYWPEFAVALSSSRGSLMGYSWKRT